MCLLYFNKLFFLSCKVFFNLVGILLDQYLQGKKKPCRIAQKKSATIK